MKFVADIGQLRTSATRIRTLAQQCQSCYQSLYQDVNAMGAAWKGKDNAAYVNQVNGFRDDFQQLYQLLADFSALAGDASGEYQQALNDSVTAARQI
ncbi:MAG: WXG100 family type VII secretion target [Oscillospiraceae bacterium]|nr:WXG100 family type VII secretion target [Oscillospiraceae bacterium]